MKYILSISCLLFLLACAPKTTKVVSNNAIAAKLNQTTLKDTKGMTASEVERLRKISPPKRVETMRQPKRVSIKEQDQKVKLKKADPNNRVVLAQREQAFRGDLNIQTQIKSLKQSRILFNDQLALDYWIPKSHEPRLREGMPVQVQYQNKFVKGVSFQSICIADRKEQPAFCIMASGANQPITSRINKNIVIRQTKKEKDFVDNKSETIREVAVVINDEQQVTDKEPLELKIGDAVYQFSVQKSWHYYPKGKDSVEGPLFILDYTLTRKK